MANTNKKATRAAAAAAKAEAAAKQQKAVKPKAKKGEKTKNAVAAPLMAATPAAPLIAPTPPAGPAEMESDWRRKMERNQTKMDAKMDAILASLAAGKEPVVTPAPLPVVQTPAAAEQVLLASTSRLHQEPEQVHEQVQRDEQRMEADDSSEDEDEEEEEEDSSDEEEEESPKRKGKKLVSGRTQTADSCRPKKTILWPPQEGIYTQDSLAPQYDELSQGQFVAGFLNCVFKAPKNQTEHRLKHLRDLMVDTVRHPWSKVRSFHAVFLQQIEQGNIKWQDKEEVAALKLQHLYLSGTSAPSPRVKRGATKRVGRAGTARMGATKCCAPFNARGGCEKRACHGAFKHACSYCYKVTGEFFTSHNSLECNRRQAKN